MLVIGPGLDELLSTTFIEFGLIQHVTLPTCSDRLLDVLVSDDAIPIRKVLVPVSQIKAMFESLLLSSELFTSPGTEVNNFADQLIITSALEAICPAKTRHECFSRRRRPPLSTEATPAKHRP